jgi:NAD-dependent dihydropyrimidine dehydrogenase PreA subunit
VYYVDENLCSGCGLCVDECQQGALTIGAVAASIDEDLCTSCGRCVEVCPTEAIVSLEVVSEHLPSPALAQNGGVESVWAGDSSPQAVGPPSSPASTTPRPATSSKLDVAERLLSGLFGLIAIALERRQRPSGGRNVAETARGASGMAKAGRGGGRRGFSSKGGDRPRDGRGRDIQKGPATRRRGIGQGRGPRCRVDGRSRYPW